MIEASIFIASMVATCAPASTVSPSATERVTTPANGAATCPGSLRSAFSVGGTSDVTDRSRTDTGRSWSFIVHVRYGLRAGTGRGCGWRVPNEIRCARCVLAGIPGSGGRWLPTTPPPPVP